MNQFRTITQIKHELELGLHRFGVFAIKKNGGVYKNPSMTFCTEAEATARCELMQELNPGSKYTVRPLQD